MTSTTDIENPAMFCFQCEQTAHGTGCTVKGVCQKDASVAGCQDFLMYGGLEALCSVALVLLREKVVARLPIEIEQFIPMAAFSTLTNVNFSADDIVAFAKTAERYRDELLAKLPKDKHGAIPERATEWKCPASKAEVERLARDLLIPKRFAKLGKDRTCLQELLVYGIKGIGAYAFHASELGANISDVVADICRYLGDVIQRPDPSVGELLEACLDCGKTNLRAMELLDAANTGAYGNPEPTTVQWIHHAERGSDKPGHAILVSGHDLLELDYILKQTEGKGIMVYTHGEMLATLAYPKLKKYPHLAGHYGTAWQNQRKEFLEFPGPIVMTTNCYIPAPETYVKRVFSNTPVGGKDVTPIVNHDFSKVIEVALSMPGFVAKHGPAPANELETLTIGFAHNTVLGVADKVIAAIKEGKLRRIFLVGGCDGFEKERNQFTDFAAKVPDDCIILTLACGKFKINMRDYGTLGGLPRLLDMGQCNDAYSALVVALALAKAFNMEVTSPDFPLSLILSWFEQKAVAILLTLLHLGLKNIWIGPRLPAFFTPAILDVLVEKFNVHLLTDADKALGEILGKK